MTSTLRLAGGSVMGDLRLSQHFFPQAEVRSPREILSTPPAMSKQQSVPMRRSSQRWWSEQGWVARAARYSLSPQWPATQLRWGGQASCC